MDMNFIVLILLALAFIALTFNQGFWTCSLMMFNITFAGIAAFNYSAPLARMLYGVTDRMYYFAEFLVIWVLFLVFFGISRAITDNLSKVPVRIGGGPIEQVMDYAFCGGALCTFMCWCLFTFFSAPVGADGFQTMMGQSGLVRMGGIMYAKWYFEVPSNLGMGLLGAPFDAEAYAADRVQRSAELKTKDGLFVSP
ncbi:hypothetical protein [Blastopirellula marina]|uniref:CvpA family protein n=1 Tax=Blastopirellula marina TaxID=124 RepID=A0A2S8G6P1_9BACT|nr:hypothetical protein [Blastopirellula marina]PQO40087.1 hypothetical protein C5Y98_07180 [Blastopirellula marina]PTL45462.1 hypothetical protein C5Y97_07180 [Blastopirellula marina]